MLGTVQGQQRPGRPVPRRRRTDDVLMRCSKDTTGAVIMMSNDTESGRFVAIACTAPADHGNKAETADREFVALQLN